MSDIVHILLNKKLQNHIQNWNATLTAISTSRSTIMLTAVH